MAYLDALPFVTDEKIYFSDTVGGKALGQLPDDRYPNYFVGGFLLDVYGLDMEFDTSFNEGGNIIAEAQKILEADTHKIRIRKLQKLAEDWLEDLVIAKKIDFDANNWNIKQHGSNNYYAIKKISGGDLYLITRQESSFIVPHRLTALNINEFSLADGLGLFKIKIGEDGRLLFISTRTGQIVKASENTLPVSQQEKH